MASPPTLYIFNSASLARKDTVENLTTELISYGVDIAIIIETHLKKKHADSCVHIDCYTLFRRDRVGRKCGGVAVYTRQTLNATVYLPPIPGNDPDYELLLIKVTEGCDFTFVGSLYHPPKPRYQENDLLNYIEEVVSRIQLDFPAAHIILAGDLNQLPDSEVVIRTGLTSLVTQPTRLGNMLDRLYVSDLEYAGVKVVTSAVKRDHRAVIAYSCGVKKTVGKKRGTSARSESTQQCSTHTSWPASRLRSTLSIPMAAGILNMSTIDCTVRCKDCSMSTIPSAQRPSHLPTRSTSHQLSNTCYDGRTS